jgi:hypothetical protein
MNDRSSRISRLKADRQSRESYIKGKIGILVPSQIKALRLRSETPKQTALAKATGSHQSRFSDLERPGEANVTLDTLAWIASVHKVGLIVKFVPFSEMLAWENSYSQDKFYVTPLDQDMAFLEPDKNIAYSTARSKSFGDNIVRPNRDKFMHISRIEVPAVPSIVHFGAKKMVEVKWQNK